MSRRRRDSALLRAFAWLFGFRLVRLALSLAVWALTLGLIGGLLASDRVDAADPTPAGLLFAIGYAVGSLLSVVLWLWYRGWWHLGDPTLRHLLRLTPRQFEEEVGRLLAALGYRDVEVSGKPSDLGADVLCTDEEDRRVVVQCKHYAPGRGIDSPAIQTFLGAMVIHRADRGIYVTTSTFTQPARALATAQHVKLIDGPELSRLLQRAQRLEV